MKTKFVLAVALGTAIWNAPNAHADAFVRFLHALPGESKVDVFSGGDKTFNDFRFGRLSEYKRVASGPNTLRVADNNPSRTLFAGRPRLRNGDFYTLIAWGTPTKPRVRLVNDSTGRAAYGRARMTFSHLSPGQGAVDVFINTSGGRNYRLVRGLRYGQAVPVNVPATPFTLRLVQYGYTIKTVVNVKPSAGRKYSVFAIGRPRESFNLLVKPAAAQ